MNGVVFSSRIDTDALEVRLQHHTGSDQPGIDDESLVEVVRVRVADGETGERLGETHTIRAALERWPELRHVGDAVELTIALDEIEDVLRSSPVLAPPEGWLDGYPNTPFLVSVNNGDDSLEFDIYGGFQVVELSSIAGSLGSISLEYIDGWLRQSGTDLEDEFEWVDTGIEEDTLDCFAVNLVLSPPMWPSGDRLEVSLCTESRNRVARIIAALTDGRADGYYDWLVINGEHIDLRSGERSPG